jgi:hypothetical protein
VQMLIRLRFRTLSRLARLGLNLLNYEADGRTIEQESHQEVVDLRVQQEHETMSIIIFTSLLSYIDTHVKADLELPPACSFV